MIDEKYGVKKVYVEGAYGEVSTKWLRATREESVRKAVMEKLIEEGRLTGAEYYSAMKNKTELIKGLEKKEEYFDNLKRMGTIIENEAKISRHMEGIKETVKGLKKKYYNKQQKKLEELTEKYETGKLEESKYYEKLKRYAQELAVDMNRYENISMYRRLLDSQEEINYNRTAKEHK